jgi:uncharacterized protein
MKMSLSMYQASVPAFTRMLTNLSKILDKGAAFAKAKDIEPSVLVNARLAPDMFPLSRQVQIATDLAVRCGARLAGVDIPSNPDTEATFTELQERLKKSIRFLEGLSAETIDGSADKSITLELGGEKMNFTGRDYLLNFILPNFYFHITAAYLILRHNGVELGKRDFLGA